MNTFARGIRIGLFAVLLATPLYGVVRPVAAGVSVGGSSADFLQFEVGGRSAGMAGAQTGLATGVTAQFWNPAALATLNQPEIGLMHANWLGDLSYEWAGYARPVGSGLGVGSVSVAYFHMPSIQGVDEFDNPTEQFRVYDLAVTLGLARPISRSVNVGANVKMIRQNLATVSATGAAVDLGTSVRVRGTTIGASAQNLGPSLSYGDAASYPLPRQFRFGASRGFIENRLLLAADYNIPHDYYKDVRMGAEFQAHPIVALRLGYRHVIGSSDDPATGLSYGLGFRYRQIAFDYALTPSDGFDNVHRFALGYSFGSGEEESTKQPEPPKKEKPLPPPAPDRPTTIASSKSQAKPPTASVRAPETVVSRAPQPARTAPATTGNVETPKAAETPKATETAKAIETAKAAETPKAPAPSKSPEPTKLAEVSKEEQSKAAKDAKPAKETKGAKPAKQVSEFAVLLPGYQSKSSAEAELKALQLLGFRVKDATIVANSGGGYSIRLAQMKSKSSADDMASDLVRMSFRAVVQTVQR
jgi:hypothetical protein